MDKGFYMEVLSWPLAGSVYGMHVLWLVERLTVAQKLVDLASGTAPLDLDFLLLWRSGVEIRTVTTENMDPFSV